MKRLAFALGLLALVAGTACSGSDETSSNSTATTTTGATGGGGAGGSTAIGGTGGTGGAISGPGCTNPTDVPCSDQVILQMNLKSDVAPGAIENEPDGDGFWTLVDATAGGAFVADPDSYVYGKFTDTGLEKVSLSDEDALDSMDWDIAFRRYVARINSGNSGPSCVVGTRLAGTPDYDSVTSVPDGLTLRADEYFTDSPDCSLIPDGTGLEGSPATVLSGYWTYSGCVAMSGNVYILQLASGRSVKLTVTEYYYNADAVDPGAAQEACNTSGTSPSSGSANIHFRWAWLS